MLVTDCVFFCFPKNIEQEHGSQLMTKKEETFWKEEEMIRHTLTLLLLVARHTLSTLVLPLQKRGSGEVVWCLPQPECLQTAPATIAGTVRENAPQTLRLGKQLQ